MPDGFNLSRAGDEFVTETYETSSESTWVEAPTLTTTATIKASILAVMAVAAIIGNTVTIFLSKKKRQRTQPVNIQGTTSSLYTLLFQLAISDLLVSIWCISGEAAWTYTVEWKAGNFLCKTFKFAQVFSLYLSTFAMVLIGLDRLKAVRHPMRRALSSDRSCMKPILTAWLLSGLLASPQFMIFRVLKGPFSEPFYQCVTYGFYTEEWQEKLYTVFSLLTMFIIPLMVLIATYTCIFWTIAKKERAFRSERQEQQIDRCWQPGNPFIRDQETLSRRQTIFRRAKAKSLRISFIIVLAFVICWTPYYFMMITFIFLNPDDKLGEDLQAVIFFFGMSNSLVNPLIYGAFHLWRPNRKTIGSFSTGHTHVESWRGSRQCEVLRPMETIVPAPTHNFFRQDVAVECYSDDTSPHIHSVNCHQTHIRCSIHNVNGQHRSSVGV